MPGLMGLDNEAKFNGQIEIQGQKLPVQNGVVQIGQRPFLVSRNGKRLLNAQNQLVAQIVDGKVNLPQQAPPPVQ